VSLKTSENYIHHDVVSLMVDNEWSPVRAWREYLNLTQTDVAQHLGISQSAYAQQESSDKLRKTSREKIAAALGINAKLLNI
jgi:transcriptional regulator with XRE-family HTH domain